MGMLTARPTAIQMDKLIREPEQVEGVNNEKVKEPIKTPIRWPGNRAKIIEKFEELYPNSDTPLVEEENTEKEEFNIFWSVGNDSPQSSDTDKMSYNHLNGIKCFIEPFAGGLANTYYIGQKYSGVEQFYGSDVSVDLINFYYVIQFYYEDFKKIFGQLRDNYNKIIDVKQNEYFTKVRNWFNRMKLPPIDESGVSIERAVGFFFLHITSFNNTYKINAKGLYNGTPTSKVEKIDPTEQLETLHNILNKVSIAHSDYQDSLYFIEHLIEPTTENKFFKADTEAKKISPEEIFVYLDPSFISPHILSDEANGSLKTFRYDTENLETLANYCNILNDKRVKWLLSIEAKDINTFIDKLNVKPNTRELVNTSIRNPSKRVPEIFVYNYNIDTP